MATKLAEAAEYGTLVSLIPGWERSLRDRSKCNRQPRTKDDRPWQAARRGWQQTSRSGWNQYRGNGRLSVDPMQNGTSRAPHPQALGGLVPGQRSDSIPRRIRAACLSRNGHQESSWVPGAVDVGDRQQVCVRARRGHIPERLPSPSVKRWPTSRFSFSKYGAAWRRPQRAGWRGWRHRGGPGTGQVNASRAAPLGRPATAAPAAQAGFVLTLRNRPDRSP